MSQTNNIEQNNGGEAVFDFDNDENIASSKTPALKAIGGGIKDRAGKIIGAGLWIANENAEIAEWKKECTSSCEYSCMDHLKGVTPHDVDTKKVDDDGNDVVIRGSVILKPRMLVIGRSPLLKINDETGYTVDTWVKGDNQIKRADGKNMYACVRRYFVIFLDDNNAPLHNASQPIQLTARGYFQMEFDKMLMFFRSTMVKAYNESTKKNATNMNEAWHSMCVFAPTFKSEMRGPSKDKQSKACITAGYDRPTKDNWLTMCVGKSGDFTQKVYKIHCDNKEWWKKSIKKDKPKSSEEEHPDDDHIYITEEEEVEKIEKGIESL
jgi:hypothetical protein